MSYRAGWRRLRTLRGVTLVHDPTRRWERELAALKAKAHKAGLDKTADTPLSNVLRETLAACDNVLHDLEIAYAEQSRLSKAAADAAADWNVLLDRLPCACVCTDVNGFILKANPAAASLLAITSRHLDARLLTHFTEDREQFSRALRRAVWDQVEVRERMSIRPRDRAPVIVDAAVMPKSPDDNNTVLWFLQPAHEAPASRKPVRRRNGVVVPPPDSGIDASA